MNGWQFFLALLMIGTCAFLMIVILLQRGRGGGLAGAFGGSGGSSAFGAKTGDVLTWITVAVAAIFLLLAVVNNFAFDQSPAAAAARAATLQSPPDAESESETPAPIQLPVTPVGQDTEAGRSPAPSGTQDNPQEDPAQEGGSSDAPVEDPPTP